MEKKKIKKINKIEKFINDNKLNFTSSGSDLNANCVILAGYSCYLKLSKEELLVHISLLDILTVSVKTELIRVFEHANKNNYGKYWETEQAKETYKF